MIEKGYLYVRDVAEKDRVKRIFKNDNPIFEVFLADDMYIDTMASGESTDTIILVLKRKEKDEKV